MTDYNPLFWEWTPEGHIRLRAVTVDPGYPLPVNVRKDVTYGIDGELVGLLDVSGDAPPTPTVIYTADGLTVTATITGGDAAATNTVYLLAAGASNWTVAGSRTGNGTVSFTATAGTFWIYTKSATGGGCVGTAPKILIVKSGRGVIKNTPAEIFAKLLQDLQFLSDPETGGEWPVFIATLPDGAGMASRNIAGVFDIAGRSDGRLANGINVLHPGVQLRIRSLTHAEGWEKIRAIASEMEVTKTEVLLDGASYIICNVSQRSGILSLGNEEGGKRRFEFSVHFVLTIQERE